MSCPAYDCSGGHAQRVHEIKNPQSVDLPEELWANKGKKQLMHCTYCGFLWFEYFVDTPSLPLKMKRAVGFYDNFTKPNEFLATPNFRLKDDPVLDGPKRSRR